MMRKMSKLIVSSSCRLTWPFGGRGVIPSQNLNIIASFILIIITRNTVILLFDLVIWGQGVVTRQSHCRCSCLRIEEKDKIFC